MAVGGLLGSPLPGTNTPQLGPIAVAGADTKGLLGALDAVIRKERVWITEIISASELAPDVLRAYGFQARPHPTMVLDLKGRSEDEAWKGLRSECRTACRKAEKLGVEVVEADNPGFLPAYLPMVDAVFTRQGRKRPVPASFYLALWQRFYASGNLTVLLAKHRGLHVAGAMFLRYKRKMYYLDGASYPESYGVRANDLIQWEAIRRGLTLGIEHYDMVGADAPGLVRFKHNFGAELVYHQRARRTASPAIDVALGSYLRLRPGLRRLRFRLSRQPRQ